MVGYWVAAGCLLVAAWLAEWLMQRIGDNAEVCWRDGHDWVECSDGHRCRRCRLWSDY